MLITKFYSADQMKVDEVDGGCERYGRGERQYRNWWLNLR